MRTQSHRHDTLPGHREHRTSKQSSDHLKEGLRLSRLPARRVPLHELPAAAENAPGRSIPTISMRSSVLRLSISKSPLAMRRTTGPCASPL
jgi:hypothetical protein